MLKLIKYELRKTWFSKAVLLVMTALAEIGYLIGLYGDREGTMVTSIGILMVLAVGGVLWMGLESVLTLHRDMNTRQSYMLFMTPNSCYKILGAKVLECGASIMLAGAFFFALGGLDVTLLFAKTGELGKLWDMAQELFSHISINGHSLVIDARSLSAVTFVMLTSWISTITQAYLAIVISAALLNGKKYNLLISFAVFLALEWALGKITGLSVESIRDSITLLFVWGGVSLVLSAIMYVVTAVIMEKKLSV